MMLCSGPSLCVAKLMLELFVLLSIYHVVDGTAYDAFQEGYLNIERNDDRPNLPYTTDTNRYSDGYSSTSGSGELSSPHFPEYVGAIANTSDRFRRFAAYMEDAAYQGIAGFGESENIQEIAKVATLNRLAQDGADTSNPQKNFTVFAALKWNPSDFAIQEGETYRVEILGSQTGLSDQFWFDGGIRVNGDGYESYYDAISSCYIALGRCRSHLKKKRRFIDGNWMGLICGIGEFVQKAEEVKPGDEDKGRYLPLDEATVGETLFYVGLGVEFYAEYTGQLICFANDAHTLYWNNQGSIEVTATRLSWPPTSETYYQGLLLPSCDSALVTYANRGDNENGTMACNPTGGGSGWVYENIVATDASYGTGAPDFITDQESY